VIAFLLQLAIAAPVASRDTAGHVDVRVGQQVVFTLSSHGNPLTSAKWSSANPSVASISAKGVLTARARGYATITAAAGTQKATTRVCVTSLEQEALPWKIKSTTTSIAGETRLRPGAQRQAIAHVQLVTSPDWGPCVHWSLDRDASEFARIDRAGVLHSSRSVRDVKAFIGPRLP
jgi:hypothetical protein